MELKLLAVNLVIVEPFANVSVLPVFAVNAAPLSVIFPVTVLLVPELAKNETVLVVMLILVGPLAAGHSAPTVVLLVVAYSNVALAP